MRKSNNSMAKNKSSLPLSPSPRKWSISSLENSPATPKRRLLRGGLDSDEENSSANTSPAPFIFRNLRDLKEFGCLDESLDSDDEIDDGIQTKSFYGKQNSNFDDLVAKKKVGNQLKADIEAKLVALKGKIEKKNKTRASKRTITKSVAKKTPNKKLATKIEKIERTVKEEMVTVGDSSNSERKRKFFSPRSPSRRLRSTIMIGNNKVQFEAVSKKKRGFSIDETGIVDEMVDNECEMFRSEENEEKREIGIEDERQVEASETCEEMQVDHSDDDIFGDAHGETEENIEKTNKTENKKTKPLYPLFTRQRSRSENEIPSSVKKKPKKTVSRRFKPSKNDKMEQLVIDVGQKEVAAVQCPECGMIYIPCDANDDALHEVHHNIRLKRLAFPGWKSERQLRNFSDGRILLVLPTDAHYMLQKLNDVWEELNVELGELDMKKTENFKFYIFVSNDKKIAGFLAVEPVTKAHRLIPDEKGSIGNCESTSVPVMCGVYRLWTLSTYRKQKIASRLLDCLRNNFIYAYVMSVTDVAFSSPTQDGAKFLTQYTGTDSFLVYK